MRIRSRGMVGAGVGILALLLCLLLRTASPQVIGVEGIRERLMFSGFFPPEQQETTIFRWSSPDAQIWLTGLGNYPVHFSMRLHGRALTNDRPESQSVRIVIDSRPIPHAPAHFEIGEGWRVYSVLLPRGIDGMLETAPVQLMTPRICPEGNDRRVLGVPMSQIVAVPLTHAGNDLRHEALAAGRAMVLALLIGLPLLLMSFTLSHAAYQRYGIVLFCMGLLLIIWAWLDVMILAWVVRWLIWAIVIGLGGVGGWYIWCWLGRMRWGVLILLPYGVLFLSLPLEWGAVASYVALGLPGMLGAILLFGSRHTRSWWHGVEDVVVGMWGGFVALLVLMLVLHAIPGEFPWWLPLGVSTTLTGILLLLMWRRPRTNWAPAQMQHHDILLACALGAIVIIGGVLRLAYVGSAEFQGDEARAMLMTVGIRFGHDEILMLHRKGPVELILPSLPMIVTGFVNEWGARFPFAIAGVLTILGGFVLTRRITGSAAAALIVAGIVALDGFFIAFSRIVQYQSVLVCATMGAAWCCWRFYEGAAHAWRWLAGAAALISVALLAHYDGIFAIPAFVWLVGVGAQRRGWGIVPLLRAAWPALLIGLLLVGGFYVPFVLHEHFGGTVAYLTTRTVSGGIADESTPLFVNNLPDYEARATFYSTTFQFYALAFTIVGALVTWLMIYTKPRWLGISGAFILIGWCVALVEMPEVFLLVPGIHGAGLGFGIALALLVRMPRIPVAVRFVVIWFGVPFLIQSFVIGDPRTHFYTMHGPAALLVAVAVAQVLEWTRARPWIGRVVRWGTGLVSGGIAALAVPYMLLVFVQQSPEYQRTFPAERPDIYRARYGDQLPRGGHFGFPHRDGWKVIGELFEDGTLTGDYFSNQRERVSGWYTRGAFRCDVAPHYYFLATIGGDAAGMHIPVQQIRQEYTRIGCVVVDGYVMMNMYEQANDSSGRTAPIAYDLNASLDHFDRQPVRHFPIQRSLVETTPQVLVGAAWEGGIRLHGYDWDYRGGEAATLILTWQVDEDAAIEAGDRVVVVVGEDETVGMPLCEDRPPSSWGHTTATHTAFTVPASGTIRVGVRHSNGTMMPVVGEGKWVVVR